MFKENYRIQNRLGQGLKYHVKLALVCFLSPYDLVIQPV